MFVYGRVCVGEGRSDSWVEFSAMFSNLWHAQLTPSEEQESQHARKIRYAIANAVDVDAPRIRCVCACGCCVCVFVVVCVWT